MKNNRFHWSKTELKIYILLLCANADARVSAEELEFIKSKIDGGTFDRVYAEFLNDDEDSCIEKIENGIAVFDYSYKELSQIKQEVMTVFKTDKNFLLSEDRLRQHLDNILY
ncbi:MULTISPECIES: hypothetical protein [Arenibacter]|uniref:hypothetical protein n=1 Tax=Arenibacter TaxID=178469 RepID=UPI000A38C01E|nr:MULTISPECIES: hypothetical protein [Arenibacter]